MHNTRWLYAFYYGTMDVNNNIITMQINHSTPGHGNVMIVYNWNYSIVMIQRCNLYHHGDSCAMNVCPVVQGMFRDCETEMGGSGGCVKRYAGTLGCQTCFFHLKLCGMLQDEEESWKKSGCQCRDVSSRVVGSISYQTGKREIIDSKSALG